MTDLPERVRAWIDQDPDHTTRTELQRLLDNNDDQLRALFAGTLTFGTAGLRAPLGVGPLRMNRVVVARAAAGLAAYLLDQHTAPRIVIGHDARHGSTTFARDTAEIMRGAGVDTLLVPFPIPTPALAYAIARHHADAGVMVTASHNPAADNGYKVYLGDTSQIVSPVDQQIAVHIHNVGSVRELPRSDDYTRLGDETIQAYLDAVCARVPDGPRTVRVAWTALHGVGGSVFAGALARCGFTDHHPVPSQLEPDPDFPTVAFPNPEEPGAMDEALDLGESMEADLVLALDPDADRLGVGIRDGSQYRMLTGDEIGSVLAVAMLAGGAEGTFANSMVSSRLLGRIAEAAGQRWTQTLTGFKWIGKVDDLAFGYEEALGYCTMPDLIRDKDGIAAGLVMLAFAAQLSAAGRTVLDVLDDLDNTHGVHLTGQVSLRTPKVAEVMARLRASAPEAIGADPVVKFEDLLGTGDGPFPPADVLRMTLASGALVTIRPSGTEPKIKCYLEVVRKPGEPDGRRLAQLAIDTVRGDVTALLSQ